MKFRGKIQIHQRRGQLLAQALLRRDGQGMNVEALEARARQLEQELDSLRVYAEEKEQEVIQAAELGKALLRDNENLEERLGEANRESMQRMEVRTDECELENTPSSHLLFFLPSLSPSPLPISSSLFLPPKCFFLLPTVSLLPSQRSWSKRGSPFSRGWSAKRPQH